jgi:argininosuccinate synthase
MFVLTKAPERAPDKPVYIEIEFRAGVPVKLNGKATGAASIIEKLNRIGGDNGIGRVDIVENRLVGIKSREVYEAPGATILLAAHRALEQLVLGRELMHLKMQMSDLFARVIYDGLWFSDLREGLSAFMDSTQRYVTGTLRLHLHKGNCAVVGRRSPFSLYRHELATYGAGDAFEHSAATGFLAIRNLPLRAEGERRESAAKPPKGPKRGK